MHQRIMLPSNDNENEILYISKTTIDENFKAISHSHPNTEILFFMKGNGFVISKEQKIKVKEYDLIIINKDLAHLETSSNYFEFYAIGINSLKVSFQESFFNKIIHISLDSKYSHIISNYYDLFFEEANNKKENYLKIINNLYSNLIFIIQRIINVSFNKMKIDDNNSAIVSSICQMIDNYYYLPFQLSEMAKKVSLSVSSICHLFKKEMNISIIEYRINKQIEEAQNLLLVTDMTIVEICDAVGFKDASYFTKVFKNKIGSSPKIYRLNKKGKTLN